MSQVITINGGKAEPRTCMGGPHKGENIWSVIDTGGTWYSMYCFDRPQKGQQYNVEVKSKQVGDKTYRDAFIVGPAPAQFAQAEAVHQLAQSIGNGAPSANPALPPSPYEVKRFEYTQAQPAPQSAPTGNVDAPKAEFKPSGKIAWADWARMAEAAWAQGAAIGMPPTECVAYVNTTLIAYSNGKIDLPVVEPLEPGSDADSDFDWADEPKLA
jgi:hypothetical protein